jgi:hypothetical protein
MALFGNGASMPLTDTGQKKLLIYTEKVGGRAAIAASLPSVIRSHYDDVSGIADDVAKLGYLPWV